MILAILDLLGSLGMFLFGMRIMSEALQKLSGERLRSMMRTVASNRVSAAGTGFLVTCLVQSSSATTVMIVGFVNASLLTLTEAIGLILGANLGTTTTFWIVSFLGFKFSINAIALPIIGLGFPLLFFRRATVRDTGEFFVGFGILFLGLLLLKDAVPSINDHPEALEFVQGFTGQGLLSVIFFFAFGTLLTLAVQSSSVAGAITLTMAYKGWIDYPSAAAIILGENVGTTVTANLAALVANTVAKRAALAHFIFNLFGVVWAIALFEPFTRLVDAALPGSAYEAANLPLHMAAFHSIFNLVNILAVIGFVPQLARLVERAYRGAPATPAGHVTYSTGSLPQTAELNLAEAERDVQTLAGHARDLLAGFLEVFESAGAETKARVEELRKIENASDALALQVTNYLIRCSSGRLSEASMHRVSTLLRITAELEDMCDCGNRLVQLAGRKGRKGRDLSPEAMTEIREFTGLLFQFIDFWSGCLARPVTAADMESAYQLEGFIDQSRKKLRKGSIQRMEAGGEAIKAEMLYIDILNNMQSIGNHSLNILQAFRHSA